MFETIANKVGIEKGYPHRKFQPYLKNLSVKSQVILQVSVSRKVTDMNVIFAKSKGPSINYVITEGGTGRAVKPPNFNDEKLRHRMAKPPRGREVSGEFMDGP